MAQLTTRLVAPTMTKSSSRELPNLHSSSNLPRGRLKKKRHHCPKAWNDTMQTIPAPSAFGVPLLSVYSLLLLPCPVVSLNG